MVSRPMKEGLDYFPHDTDACNDEKVEALRALYGNDGYAFYFILLERIYRTADFELDVSGQKIEIHAKRVGVNRENFNKMLETAFVEGCFDREAYEARGVLTSKGIQRRSSRIADKRETERKRYQQKKDGQSDDVSASETNPETQQKPDKKAHGEFNNVTLTDSEYKKLTERLGKEATDGYIEKLSGYMKSRNKRYLDHYATILNWWRKDDASKPGGKTGVDGWQE